MPEQRLKIAIVGCGKMAANHLDKVVQMVPPSDIALCDIELVKAQLLGEMYGISNLYDSMSGMAEAFRPDIYHIVTPPASHKQLALASMQAGGHVYIEKPVCLTSQDFAELKQAAVDCGRLVCAGHQRIFEKEVMQIRELLQKKTLGRVIHLQAYDSAPYLEMEDRGIAKGWWTNFTGGMFLDLLPHMMSVFNALVDDLRFEHAFVRTDSRKRPAEMHGILCSDSSAVTCGFHISFSTKFVQNYFQIECEKGIIVLNCRNRFWYVVKKSKLPDLVERLVTAYSAASRLALGNSRSILSLFGGKYDPYEGIGALMERFYEAVRKGNGSPTPMPAVQRIVELCEQTIRASFDGLAGAKKPVVAVAGQQFDEADVLVTGAGGFIGRHLVQRLLNQGMTVRAMVRHTVPENHFAFPNRDRLQVCVGDLTTPEFAVLACRGVRSVYHLAAATKGDIFSQTESTCVGTQNLLAAVKENNVDRLVYVSSVSILDQTNFPGHGKVGDDFPLEAYPLKRGAYTYSKLKAEAMVRTFAAEHKIRTVILRPGIVWGPGSESLLLETNFKLGSRLLIVLGRAGKRLPLVYVDNLVDALIKAGDADVPDSGPMNIVDSDSSTQRGYLNLIEEMGGKRYTAFFIPISLTLPLFWVAEKALGFILKKRLNVCYQLKSKRNCASYSTERAQSKLGWRTRVPFSEALMQYLEWANAKEQREAEALARPTANSVAG